MLASAGGLIWWFGHRTQESERGATREPVPTRLTANPLELTILSAMISPDGRYVAYTDPSGIQVRIVDTGESQRLPDTKNMAVYGWTTDSTKVRASRCDGGSCAGWSISLVGNARYRTDGTWLAGEVPLPMPRGSQLLRKTTSRELHIDPLDGTGPRLIAKNVDSWTPSADGRRVLFVSSNIIQSVPATAGLPVTVWKGPDGLQILDVVDLPDHRMIVALARVRADNGIALHLLQTDSTGVVVHAPRRLTDWRQELPRY